MTVFLSVYLVTLSYPSGPYLGTYILLDWYSPQFLCVTLFLQKSFTRTQFTYRCMFSYFDMGVEYGIYF